MDSILNITQLILSIILIAIILLQQKGSGMGAAFGGSNSVYTTKRGIDKIFHNATIVIAIIFCLVSILRVVIY